MFLAHKSFIKPFWGHFKYQKCGLLLLGTWNSESVKIGSEEYPYDLKVKERLDFLLFSWAEYTEMVMRLASVYQALPKTGSIFAETFTKDIFAITAGHPGLSRYLYEYVLTHFKDKGDDAVRTFIQSGGVVDCVRDCRCFISLDDTWEKSVGQLGLNVLTTVLREGKIDLAEPAAVPGLKDLVTELVRRGVLVERNNRQYTFFNPFFRAVYFRKYSTWKSRGFELNQQTDLDRTREAGLPQFISATLSLMDSYTFRNTLSFTSTYTITEYLLQNEFYRAAWLVVPGKIHPEVGAAYDYGCKTACYHYDLFPVVL